MAENGSLQIGEIAGLADVSVDTVRYYEKLKLLPTATRTNSGYRMFSVETADRIRFIKQAQEMGFTLDEIKQLFVSGGGENQCKSVRDLIQIKLSELEDKMRQMKSFKDFLNRHLVACENELTAHGTAAECPVFTTIEISRK
ncbi:MAG TPA: heavy metal-responsive transcriptional regulator [Blastocatellia bacterium]|nr:heavy metal-responsive transcriptional regulator [Blastocatellia bacterium]